MSQDPKVVSIKPNLASRNMQSAGTGSSSLPAPLISVRDHLQQYLSTAFNVLFDNADDNLFEMADRATSNADQTLFFEAMRTVRLQRGSILKSIGASLHQVTEQMNGEAPAAAAAYSSFELDSLTLVQPDELEQSVALDGMISRVNNRNQQALMHLAMRTNSLVKNLVDERNNPLAPAALADYFADALKPLALEIKVRLIIFKLFERYVFNGIDAEYEALNTLLVNAGVMPDLRLAQVTPSRRRSPPAGAGNGAAAESSPGNRQSSADQQEVLSMFSELIGNWRHASGDMALSGLSGSAARTMPSDELLQVLADIPLDELPDRAADSPADMRQRIQRALQAQRQSVGAAEQKVVGRVDDDVISLVSMLFDFILEDPALPAAVKAMIGRLQLPVLRVAIADKSFFSRGAHPARRLLNELARATMGWNDHDDLRRDQLHGLLESIVERLLAVSEPQDALFETLHAELTDFQRNEQRRSDRIEQRTRDAEEGRARMQAARSHVAKAVNGLLVGRTLPVTLVDLLRDTWSQVLHMVCLREGVDSAAWDQAIRAAQQMIDSVEPVPAGELQYRADSNEQVLEALRRGLELLGLDASAVAVQVARLAQPQALALAKAQDAAARKVREAQAARLAAEAAQTKASGAAETVAETERAAEQPLPVAEAAVLQPEQAQTAEAVMPVVEPIEQVHVEAPVLQAEEESEPLAETVDDLPSVGAMRWIESLRAGCWFRLGATEGQPEQRCKLAAIISFSGKYIFVNRGGMKVAEFGKNELAQHFEQGLITLLDENQLFDRALESVIGNLRRLQSAKP